MDLVIINFVRMLFTLMWLLIITRVILSWVMPQGGGPLVAFIYQVTEPILAPIRRVLPPAGGFDWSPLIAMLLMSALMRFIIGLGNM
jgi:YggT family protein